MKKILAIALYCLANLAFAQSLNMTTPGGIDPDSFGRSATYLGQFHTPTVWFDPVCSTDTVTFNSPDDKCVTVPTTTLGSNDPGVSIDVPDLGSMVIPGGSTHSQIWPVIINHLALTFNDPGPNANAIRATFMGRLVITIESAVLNDPSIIDPSTGQPANGKVVSGLALTHGIDQMPVQFLRLRERAGGPGMGAFTYSLLRDTYGLNKKQLADLLRNPITLRFGLTGTVRNAHGSVMVAIRVMGD